MPRDVLVRFQMDERLYPTNDDARKEITTWVGAALGTEGIPAGLKAEPDVVAVVGPEFPRNTILPCPV